MTEKLFIGTLRINQPTNAAWQVSLSLYVFVDLKYIVYFKYVCADSQRPSQQVFNPVGTEPLVPGYNL